MSSVVLTLFFITVSLCQQFNSGITKLSHFSTGSNTYSLNYPTSNHQLVLSLSSFTFQSNTTCHILKMSLQQTIFTCTANIDSIAYLYFEKTPLTFAHTFTFYFFEGNNNYSALWKAPINLTLIKHPQLRAVLCGFVLGNGDKNTLIQLNPLADNSGINISRSLNVNAVNFSFILIQNFSPYNLTFNNHRLSSSTLNLKSQATYLNFWGIQSFKIAHSYGSNFFVQTGINPALATDSNILSINNFTFSKNIGISALFIVSNSNLNNLNCSNSYYSPESAQCVSSCPYAFTVWNTSQSTYKFCLSSSGQNSWYSVNFTDNNLADIANYKPIGCLKWSETNNLTIVCESCSQGWEMLNGSCVCSYGYYLQNGLCKPCTGIDCEISTDDQWTVKQIDAKTVAIQLKVSLPSYQIYKQKANSTFQINVIINENPNIVNATFDNMTNTILLQVINVSQKQRYSLKIGNNQPSQNELFYVNRKDKDFLWALQRQHIIQASSSSKQIIQSVAPVFSNTDKSFPLILLIIFFVGDKINAISIFQTVSLIYLINFIPLSQQYAQIKSVIKNIFIFQPQPFFKITGKEAALINVPIIDTNQIVYDPLIKQYTQGQLFLSLSFNNITTLTVQIILIIVAIKLIKKCLSPSSNRVGPNHEQKISIERSSQTKNGKLKWIGQPFIKSAAPFRMKIWIYFCILDSKKWIAITSLVTMQLLSVSFFIIYELTLPIISLCHTLSQFVCFLVFLLILVFPLTMYNYEPLYLLKCTTLIYKRRSYNKKSLWGFFYLNYLENIVYPLIVLSSLEAKYQLIGIITIQLIKVVIMRKVIKRIELIKVFTLIFFFGSLLAAEYLASSVDQTTMLTVIACSLLGIIAVQILKLIRSVIVCVLSLFKDKPEEPKQANKKDLQQVNPNPEKKMKLQSPKYIIPEQVSTLPFNNSKPLQEITNAPEISKPVYKSRAFLRRMHKQAENI